MTSQEEQEINELKKLFQEKKISVDEFKKRLIEVRLKYRKQQARPRPQEPEREEDNPENEGEPEGDMEEEHDFPIIDEDF